MYHNCWYNCCLLPINSDIYELLLGNKNRTPLIIHISLLLDYHILYSSTSFQEKNNVQMSEAACIQIKILRTTILIKILRTTILYVLKLGLSHSGKNVG